MATITVKGEPTQTIGELPAVGSAAPEFSLAGADLGEVSLASFGSKKKLLNIVPSLDTGICVTSARRFNEAVGQMQDTVLLNISADLPFAQKRLCASEKLEHIVSLSTFRSADFGKDYGVTIVEGPLAGLTSRSVLVLDGANQVIYTQQVPEHVLEPDYDAALTALNSL